MNVFPGLSHHRTKTAECFRSVRSVMGIGFAGFLLAAATFIWAPTTFAADGSVWQLTPYRVQVFVAVAPQPPLSSRLETELCERLALRIEAVVGAPWNASVSTASSELRAVMLKGVADMLPDQIPLPTPEFDKILLVAVTIHHGDIVVTSRDFDVRTRMLSSAVARPVWQLGTLCDAALDAMLSAFAPLARNDHMERRQLIVRPKAFGLPTRDPKLVFIRDGEVFQPIFRYNTREGQLRRAVPVSWSFCTVAKISPEEVRCNVYSGTRSSLVKRGRRRVESLTLRVVPPKGPTKLTLQSRTEPKIVLPGYDVYSHPPGSRITTYVGRTDRQGCLLVPPGKELLRVLLVKNGGNALARLPLVPGLKPQQTAVVINDDQRLRVEGFITGLQEELVDLVTRREILMARVRARIEANKLDNAGELLDELRRLPSRSHFSMRIIREQERRNSNDPTSSRKVDLLLSDTGLLINKHLDPAPIEQLERELRTAKKNREK